MINFNFAGSNFVSSRLGHFDVASDQQSFEGRSAKHLRRRRVVDEVASQSGISSEVDVHALHRRLARSSGQTSKTFGLERWNFRFRFGFGFSLEKISG